MAVQTKVTVVFNQVEEFIDELGKDAGKVDRGIVRCTKLFEASRMSPNIRFVSAFSAYTVDGQVITFSRYCGDTWGINSQEDAKVIAKADSYIKSIEEACKRLNLEVRPGKLETGEEPVKKSPGRKDRRRGERRSKDFHPPYQPPLFMTAGAITQGHTLNPKAVKKGRG